MASSLRVNAIVPASGTNVAIGTAGGTITYNANVSGVSTFSNGISVGTGASISSPATNVLTVSTNNVERIRVGAAGSIGIGTDNPTKLIDMSGVHSGINTTGRFVMSPHAAGWDTGVTSGNIHHHYIDNFRIYSGQIGSGTERFKVDSSGRVTMPYQPFFYAKAGASRDNQTSNPTVFNSVVTNVGNHYDGTTNYRFTAPVAGVYLFTSQPGYKETSDDASWKLYKNGAAFTDFVRVLGGLNSHSSWSCAALVYLNVNEYVHIGWDGSAGGYHQNPDMSYFSGVLIG